PLGPRRWAPRGPSRGRAPARSTGRAGVAAGARDDGGRGAVARRATVAADAPHRAERAGLARAAAAVARHHRRAAGGAGGGGAVRAWLASGVALSTFLFDLDGTLIDSIELILPSYLHPLGAPRGPAPRGAGGC